MSVRQYGAQVRKWLRDAYEFEDGIRRPQMYRDFAKRPRPGEPVEDFYLTLELAKLISLRSSSKDKLKYARLLDVYEHNGQMSLFHTSHPSTVGSQQPAVNSHQTGVVSRQPTAIG
ncbi:MAG: hypothetical protein LCH81_00120 [Bacteroidetes bacterium]|nr:hypothetical protein [Bacteroidota bacterium]